MTEFLKSKDFLVLSGKTGSGKTALLKELPIKEKIDIEDLAAHRGSSFGKHLDRDQPTQATFENALSLGLRQIKSPVLIEDESKVIGSLHIPEPLYKMMASGPIIQLEVSLEARIETIFEDYVLAPYRRNIDLILLKNQLSESVKAIHRRLGGALTDKVIKMIHHAFSFEIQTFANHRFWIETLLIEYYDRAYDHSSQRNQRTLAFKGNYEECREWICSQYV